MGKILLGYVRGPQGETGPEGDLQTAEGTVSISNIYKIIESDDVDGTALEIHTGAEPNRVYVQGIKSTDYFHTIIGTKFENGDGWQQKIQVTNEITSEPPEFVWRYLVGNVPSEWFEFKGASVLSEDTTAVASDVRVGKTYLGNDTYDEVGTGTLGNNLTATATDILISKTAVGKGGQDITGSIPSVGSSTVTPTKQEQTAVSAGNYVSGDIKVAAIPSNYVDRGSTAMNAVATDVRTGKTFIGANDQKLIGSLTEAAGHTAVASLTADQTLAAANTINTGAQIVKKLEVSNLAAGNIKNGVVVAIKSNDQNLSSVTGNYGSTTTLTDTNNLLQGQIAIGNHGANVYTGTLVAQGGQNYTPKAAQTTLVTQPKKITGNIVVLGDANLIPGNIKKGVTIFGVAGSYQGGSLVGKGATLYAVKDGVIQQGFSIASDKNGIAGSTTWASRTAIGPLDEYSTPAGGIIRNSWLNTSYDYITFSTGSNQTFNEADTYPMLHMTWGYRTFENKAYNSLAARFYYQGYTWIKPDGSTVAGTTGNYYGYFSDPSTSSTWVDTQCSMFTKTSAYGKTYKECQYKGSGYLVAFNCEVDTKVGNITWYINNLYFKLE